MSDDALSLQAQRDPVIGGDVVGRDKIVNLRLIERKGGVEHILVDPIAGLE